LGYRIPVDFGIVAISFKKRGRRMTVELTIEQKDVIDKLAKGVKSNKPLQTCGGYAGTGKTTIVRTLRNKLNRCKVCAYTGKAADVLKRKGVDASTIHSLIYEPVVDSFGNVEFALREFLECDSIIIDEASMVSREIFKDLESFGLPLICVGDHGQLPPVSGNGFNLMENPEYRLEEVHRNAGDIAHFANHIRQGFDIQDFRKSDQISFVYNMNDDVLSEVDQVICAYNKTRVQINQQIRAKLGYKPKNMITVGEKVMCLRNSKRVGIFNGMQGRVKSFVFDKGRLYIDFDANGFFPRLEVDISSFNSEKPDFDHDPDSPHPFEYAYCITCHKAQGDEWDVVCVVEQKCDKWDHIRWLYTAVSRAKSKVVLVPADKRKTNTNKIDLNNPDVKEMFGL
jgi:exodeoxyribonuclease-5